MLLRGLLCGVIAVLTGCGGGEERVVRDDLPRKLDAELAKRAEELGVPGGAAYASVGKMITAALAVRLAEQGRLSLDDPVRKWVPAWPGERSKTLRDLLGHAGGIEDAPERFYLAQLRRPARRVRPADWLAAIRPPHPEDSVVYNNSGFVTAGLVLRRAAGEGWLDLLRDTAPGIALQPDQREEGEPARGYVYPEGAGDPRPFGDDGPFVPSTSLPGFHTDLTHLPEEGLTLVAVWNDELIDQGRIPQTLMEVALRGG
jgi:CubicO group peptidase (beta-lactamase class C family)